MKLMFLSVCLFMLSPLWVNAQSVQHTPSTEEQEIINLSKQKWHWMEEKNVEKLTTFFHPKAKFVHMSGTWGTEEELEIIKTGRIWYKKAEVHQAVVQVFGETAIIWNRITLQAVVRGTEVSNPFTATEVYEKVPGGWRMLALTFSSVRPEHGITD